jgi:hypothetical protein
MTSDSQVCELQWFYDGHMFSDTMRILDIGAYDAILGKDWLDRCGPMMCHWAYKRLEFEHNGEQVTVQGLDTQRQAELTGIYAATLQELLSTEEVWAMAVLDSTSPVSPTVVAPDFQALLSEFEDIFSAPTTLPPRRALDHAITLDSTAQPVNSCPYCYSPLQKDEIKRQVQEMIAATLITTSMSLFALPGQEERWSLEILCRLSETQFAHL